MRNKSNALNQPFGRLAQAAPRLQPTLPWWRGNGLNDHTNNGARPPRWFGFPIITNGATARDKQPLNKEERKALEKHMS